MEGNLPEGSEDLYWKFLEKEHFFYIAHMVT